MLTDQGHAPNRVYIDTDGQLHLNGAVIYTNETGLNISGSRVVAAGAGSLALTVADHDGRTVLADQAAGVDFTLPAGSANIVGAKFRILISVTDTSNDVTVSVANNADYMIGLIQALSDDGAGGPVKAFATTNTGTVATESDTVTLNRTTTGTAVKGQWLEFELVSANVWAVRGMIAQSGTEATPFSAAV